MRWAVCSALLLASAVASAAEKEAAVLALNSACPVGLVDAGHAAQGKDDIASIYKGYTYLFSKPRMKVKFDANPERYAIQLEGYSPVSRTDNRDEKGDPAIYSVHNNRIYIFKDAKQKAEFDLKPEDFLELRKADNPARNDGG